MEWFVYIIVDNTWCYSRKKEKWFLDPQMDSLYDNLKEAKSDLEYIQLYHPKASIETLTLIRETKKE